MATVLPTQKKLMPGVLTRRASFPNPAGDSALGPRTIFLSALSNRSLALPGATSKIQLLPSLTKPDLVVEYHRLQSFNISFYLLQITKVSLVNRKNGCHY